MCVHITSDLLLLSRFLLFANSRLTKGVTFCHDNALNHVIQLLDLEPSVGFDIHVLSPCHQLSILLDFPILISQNMI
jgi:hypothetical protein